MQSSNLRGGPSGDSPVESRRIPRYLAHCHHTYASGEHPKYWRSFLNDRELSDLSLEPWDCEAWRTYPGREVAELHTRSRLLMRGYWADRYFLGERVFDTPIVSARRRVPYAPPRHMCLLEGLTREDLEVEYRGFSVNDFLTAGDFPSYFASRMQAPLPEVLEYTQERKTHKTAAYYRAETAAEVGGAAAPAVPAGVVLGDVPFPPGMEVVLDPGLGLGSGIVIPTDLRQAPPPVQLDPEHTTHELENGRLRRHQSRQSEVERLRTRLEVEGIPLDSSDEDEMALLPIARHHLHPPPAVAGPSRRQRSQVSSFVQSIPDDLWQVPPMNQLVWLKYFKDLKPDYGFLSWLVTHFNPDTMVFRFEDSEVTPTYEEICAVMDHHPEQNETPALPPGPRYDLAEIVALCPVLLPEGINMGQGLPLEPFLNKVLSTDLDLPWIRACCFLLLNVYAMKNRRPGIGDFRLLTVVRDMQLYHHTVFMMIMGETMCWVRDIVLHITDFNVHHRGCPLLLQAWALDKLSLIPLVPARLITTYGPAIFQSRSRRRFDYGDNPTIRWTCPWWRIRLDTIGSMNSIMCCMPV
ncbi:hypothetical protein JCGZ_17159 [Jatropha curcas]|uniref:Aminotransferase-like plant mobile domain-containing protein n=1 Tax=Jatropha curcas TaxID=180498 RepID=A0A067KEN1_JATCU|nr:hypothetical protein JCGZ_17159 [Jatropha curcas]